MIHELGGKPDSKAKRRVKYTQALPMLSAWKKTHVRPTALKVIRVLIPSTLSENRP